MAYDWEKAGEGDNDARVRMRTGAQDVAVYKIFHHDRNGSAYKSRNGDAQFIVVYCNRENETCTEMITCSDAAAWKIARMLKAGGKDLKHMKELGIEPKDFSNPETAKTWLMGLTFRADVQYEKAANNQEYASVTPLRAAPEQADDEIPM